MRISLNWLREYIDVPYSPEELAGRLTMVGLEVESIDYLGRKYEHFVVGEVLEVAKHPNADKLSVCKVNVGKEILQIVCGAPNVAPAQKVAVGLIGAEVPKNQHDPNGKPFKLTQVKIRGTESFGMICSAYELDLGDDKNGILVLESSTKPGLKLSTYYGLDDVVFEVGITPNRPDAMSHIGVAREVAALTGKALKYPACKLKESKRLNSKFAAIRIEDLINCPRYTARVILGVQIGSSPKWIQDRLTAIGVRPVNNIVDITNYVLMECGHPLHAFDYDKLKGHTIIVKSSKPGDEFTTLDHKKRKLDKDTLMICDAGGPVAIAGVMGGENTEISDSTANVLLESAYFNPRSIRKTSKSLSLSTDASQRFERGTDPNSTVEAIDRAADLIQQFAGGEVLKKPIDCYPKKILPRKISLRTSKVNDLLGVALTKKDIVLNLKKINIDSVTSKSSKKASPIDFIVPTYRPDIEREVDLIEEVARVYGYDNIHTSTRSNLELSQSAPIADFTDTLRDWLCGSGYNEVVANSMQDEDTASMTSRQYVKIANPISREMSSLRTSLVPGILQIIRNNIYQGNKNLRLFEFGKVYFQDKLSSANKIVGDFIEDDRIMLAYTGAHIPLNWSDKQRHIDIFDVKGEIQTLFRKIFLDKFKFIPYSTTKALTQSGLTVEINSKEDGYIGVVSGEMLRKFEIEQDVFVVEISVDALSNGTTKESKYKSLPRFPSVLRDIAFVVDAGLSVEMIGQEIRFSGNELLRKIELFDIYSGNQLDPAKKSCAFALEFRAEDRTLSQEEIDQLMQKIIRHIAAKFDATVRT